MTLAVRVAPKDCSTASSRLSVETIYRTSSKTLGKHESFTHPDIRTYSPGLNWPEPRFKLAWAQFLDDVIQWFDEKARFRSVRYRSFSCDLLTIRKNKKTKQTNIKYTWLLKCEFVTECTRNAFVQLYLLFCQLTGEDVSMGIYMMLF